MPASVIALLTVALAAAAALTRPRIAFGIVVAATVLVPDSLALPTGIGSVLTVHLVVTIGAFGGLLWRTVKGRVAPSAWRPTAATLGLAGYLLVAMVVGLALAAPAVSATAGDQRAVDLVQQLLVLVVCIALIREDGRPIEFVAPIVAALFVSAGIGIIEHFTHDSWGHFLFSRLPSQAGTPAAAPLQLRGGGVRSRAGADFSLSYAIVLVAMGSMLAVWLVRSTGVKRWLLAVGGLATLLAIYWSYTRSALLALVAMLFVFGIMSRRWRVTLVMAAVLAIVGITVLTLPSLGHHFSAGVDQGSINVREQRVPIILSAIAGHPFNGLGLSGLSILGVSAVDSTYLLVYGETGALGLAALAAALVVAFWSVGRGLASRDLEDRVLVAGVLGGIAAVLVGGIALDAIDLPSVADVIWELAAIGIVTSELALGPERLLRPVRSVALAAAGLAAVGAIVFAFAPTHYAASYTFFTLPSVTDATGGDYSIQGNTAIHTACGAMQAEAQRLPGLTVSCRDPYLWNGEGALRLQAGSASAVSADQAKLAAIAKRAGLPYFVLLADTPIQSGRPSGMVTLPAALAIFGLIVAFGAPLLRRERQVQGFRVVVA